MRHQVAVTSSSPSYSLVLHFVLLYFHGTPSVLFFLAGRSFGTANCERQSQRVTKGGINVTFENFSKALSTVHVSKNSPMRLSTNILQHIMKLFDEKKIPCITLIPILWSLNESIFYRKEHRYNLIINSIEKRILLIIFNTNLKK